MHITLHDFYRLTPEDQARVTFLDLSIASEEDLWRMRRGNLELDDAEEYVGEARDRGLR